MIQSLACHLSHALPQYKQALVAQLSRNLGTDLNNMGVEELFALLFKEPLSAVGDPGRNMRMVIDGLDESEYQGRNELLDVIANQFCKLPIWIRFLVTARPALSIAEKLKHLKPLKLKSNDAENIEDVRVFCLKKLQRVLVLKSEGLMLYAHFLILAITENPSIFHEGGLVGSSPSGISAVYHSYFKRLEHELIKELNVREEHLMNLLSAITASREPLPVAFVSKLLVPGTDSLLTKRKVLRALNSVSALLPIRDDCVHVIHKSVKDWLTDISCYGEHEFIMDENDGHRLLAYLCTKELENVKLKGVDNLQFSATERYALYHDVQHMLQEGVKREPHKLDELTKAHIIDLEVVYAKTGVNSTIAAEDLLWLKKQGIFPLLSKDNQSIVDTLLFVLRKNLRLLTDTPCRFLETILNQGGKVLTVEASNLLRNKYPEIPYMEVVHKETQQGGVVAQFQCSSEVICSDVSPQLDYMVCECSDGMLQLWSLHTGKLMWTRPVVVEKRIKRSCTGKGYRNLPLGDTLSLFRSVVFHPTKECILPGIISQAYIFESVNDCGFLFGELIDTKDPQFLWTFGLDKQRLLRPFVGEIELVDTKYANRNDQGVATEAEGIALSLDGQTVSVASGPSVTAYDVSSGKLKAEINCRWITIMRHPLCPVSILYRPLCPVRGGALILTNASTVELWSGNLDKRIKRWINLPGVKKLIPISEERVAVVGEVDVKVLDTISGKVVSTIPLLQGEVLTCNSKCQLFIQRTLEATQFLRPCSYSLQLLDGKTVVWGKEGINRYPYDKGEAFSPMEQFLVVGTTDGTLVLDAETGNTLRTLRPFTFTHYWHCTFISDDTCVISGFCLTVQLFNVKSGELLTEIEVEGHVTCFAACPFNLVLAIGLWNSTPNFKVIRVHLPRGEGRGNMKSGPSGATLYKEERLDPPEQVSKDIPSYRSQSKRAKSAIHRLGISAVYHSYFKRLEHELIKELNVREEHLMNLLSAITASREPLPVAFVSKLLVPGTDSLLTKRKVLRALNSVSALLPIRDDCVHVIHKSVKDWLTDISCYGEHEFIMDENDGHRLLAYLCTKELENVKLKGVKREPHKLDELTKAHIIDLEVVYAKTGVNSTIAAEDLLWLKKQGIFPLLSKDNQSIYPEIPYMEVVHKETQQGGVVAQFQCSSEVICSDVSPQLD
ncbi:unnamed protein product, partial [Porites evermanni]